MSSSPFRFVLTASFATVVIAAVAACLGSQSVFTPFCFGTPTACPCGNGPPQPDTGCMNSFGVGGKIEGLGHASLSNDTVVLHASNLPTTTTIIFFQGDEQANGGLGTVFGDGLRCVQGVSVWRLGVRQALGGSVSLGHGIPGDPVISVRGHVPAGAVMHYQGWYRNAAAFCTPDGFNLTNAISVQWDL